MSGVRPTIRCLWADLLPDIGGGGVLEAQCREGRQRRTLPHPSLRLDELQHPVMDDARSFFTEEFAAHLSSGAHPPHSRSFSLGQTRDGSSWGMVWYKARANNLRGLVCRVAGTFWVGWEDDRSGNYGSFNSQKDGSSVSSLWMQSWPQCWTTSPIPRTPTGQGSKASPSGATTWSGPT